MKRPPSRAEGELPAARRHSHNESSAPSESSMTSAAMHNGIRMGSLTSYALLERVGAGAFGVVRKAQHLRTGKVFAIKSPRSGGEEELLREASLLVACRGNPQVVKLREVARGSNSNPDDVHLVMEFVGPKDLHDVLLDHRRLRRPFTEAEARVIMRQLLAGAMRMHACGIVHCDLKPGNVLVGRRRDGRLRLKICDFGLAVSVPVPPPAGAGLQGTPRYMAPELLLGGTDRVPAVDVWSLGCVMAEIIAGRPLFFEAMDAFDLGVEVVRFLGISDDVSELPLRVTTPSKLRDVVPEERLSQAGFDVLRGLLEYHPKDRLTAAAALQMTWFSAETNEPPSLELKSGESSE